MHAKIYLHNKWRPKKDAFYNQEAAKRDLNTMVEQDKRTVRRQYDKLMSHPKFFYDKDDDEAIALLKKKIKHLEHSTS